MWRKHATRLLAEWLSMNILLSMNTLNPTPNASHRRARVQAHRRIPDSGNSHACILRYGENPHACIPDFRGNSHACIPAGHLPGAPASLPD